MLTLLTFPSSFGEPSHSPFCVKAMILLQMSGQTWARKDIGNPAPMPHGKLPVLKSGDALIPDSEFIQDWLTHKDANFYPNCSPEQRAIGHATIRMVEDGLRLHLVHDRWLDDRCWDHIWPEFFAEVPRPIRKLISKKARKTVRAGLLSHGIAKLKDSERIRKSTNDLDALGGIIGSHDFMLGVAPTAVDAAVLPILSMIDRLPFETELTQILRNQDWVEAYLKRGRETLYAGLIT